MTRKSFVERTLEKGRSVKQLTLEMKALAELMVEAAHLALISDNKEIADDVAEMKKNMEVLLYELQVKLMLTVRTPEEADELVALMHVGSSFDRIGEAAIRIANVVKYELGSHPITAEVLKEMSGATIRAPGSMYKNETLMGLRTKGVTVIGLKKGGRWTYMPEDEVVIEDSDVIIGLKRG